MTRIRKKAHVDRSVLDLARERLALAFARFDHVAVSFSGGKDSTVCLNLALGMAQELGKTPLHVFFFDEECIPDETVDYVRRVAALPDVRLDWYCLPVKHRNACSRQHPWWYPWDPAGPDLWTRPLPPEGITAIPGYHFPPPEQRVLIPEMVGHLFPPSQYGSVCMVLGIRAQESLTRLRAVLRRDSENFLVLDQGAASRGNLWKVYPIYDWRTEDVWTAPTVFGWDVNAAYDRLEMAGLPMEQQRCAVPFGEEPLQKLWTFKTCWPEMWDKLSVRVPGANTALLYATTELWAFGKKPELPAGMTWQDLISHYISLFAPEEQGHIAARIMQEINNHYRKTLDPITTAPHPVTGISWPWLTMLAQRGDFKKRRKAEAETVGKDPAGLWQRYQAALAAEQEERHHAQQTTGSPGASAPDRAGTAAAGPY